MCYCVFDKIIFSNSKFAVTPTSKIFSDFVMLTQICILIYPGDITTISINSVVFMVHHSLSVPYLKCLLCGYCRWNACQKSLFLDTLI